MNEIFGLFRKDPTPPEGGMTMPETPDLLLCHPKFADWRDMYRNVWSREETAKHMLWKVTRTEEEARQRMARSIAHQQKNPTCWFVYERASGQAIGFAGMLPVSQGIWEDCGIALGPDFTGRGYGKQLLNLLTDYARRELGAVKFIASCRSRNAPSRGMILSCGFRFTHSEDRTDPRTNLPYVLEFYEKLL